MGSTDMRSGLAFCRGTHWPGPQRAATDLEVGVTLGRSTTSSAGAQVAILSGLVRPMLAQLNSSSRRPLSCASLPFTGPILKGMSGRRPFVKGLVEALRTYRVRSCLRPVGAETNVPLALMLVRMALRPISKTRSLWRLPFAGLPSRSVVVWTAPLRQGFG